VNRHTARPIVAELLGTALLVIAVVGSGIMAQRLSADVGLQLLENAAATAGALVALILVFGPVSGAHFNPIVSLLARLSGEIDSATFVAYAAAQVVGGCLGTVLANVMFDLPAIELASTARTGANLWVSEVIATIGLLVVIHGCVRGGRASAVPFAVGLWIGGAYWFTSSTSFANPAVTIARTLTNTFTGIEPASAPMFIVAQLLGGMLAFPLVNFLFVDHGRDS
jgi:glycerol uptake facilitator-like aquaporin